MLQQSKGILASVTTAASGVIAFLPAVDMILKVGVETVGLIAGIYAARYWRHKWQTRNHPPKHKNHKP